MGRATEALDYVNRVSKPTGEVRARYRWIDLNVAEELRKEVLANRPSQGDLFV